MKRLLVGTDFSPAATNAVRRAAAWAAREHAALRIVHVLPPRRWLTGLWGADREALSSLHRNASAALKQLCESIDPMRAMDLSTGLNTGAASATLVKACEDYRADAVVIGASGEHAGASAAASLGGTARKLLSATPAPLLLSRNDPDEPAMNILAAVDLSPLSARVLDWAHRSAASRSHIDVMHVFETPFSARLDSYGVSRSAVDLYARDEKTRREQQLSALVAKHCAGRKVRQFVERGDATSRLSGRISRSSPDLIVLGSHRPGRRGQAPEHHGSVCEYVCTHFPTDVLVVPPARHRRAIRT